MAFYEVPDSDGFRHEVAAHRRGVRSFLLVLSVVFVAYVAGACTAAARKTAADIVLTVAEIACLLAHEHEPEPNVMAACRLGAEKLPAARELLAYRRDAGAGDAGPDAK